jgi:starvation-inducible DNA-binding protein
MNYLSANKINKSMKEAVETAMAFTPDPRAHLIERLKVLLANGYVFYYDAHSAHWNIVGSNFPQYHSFFEKVYTQVYEELDDIAERIRIINGLVPLYIKDLLNLSTIEGNLGGTGAVTLLNRLEFDNKVFLYNLKECFELAEHAEEVGLSNFLQDRIDAHKKLEWMIESTLKGE